MTVDEFSKEFYLDPSVSYAMGHVSNCGCQRDAAATVVTATFQLLDRGTKQSSGKWLWFQMQPHDALALAASILALAKDAQWTLPADFDQLVERVSMSKTGRH